MGFGFNLAMVFIILPLSALLLFISVVFRKYFFAKILAWMWIFIIAGAIFISIMNWAVSKTELDASDYYGEYVIDRDFFPGEQADWQYNHYRFEVTKDDSIFFYVTDHNKILHTYKGTVRFTNHISSRMDIEMSEPVHHVVQSDPTTVRSAWSFYLVFYSPYYNNMFFKKGRWKEL